MKIGLVVERFDPLHGGLEQWAYQFASQLPARGHEVHVVSSRFGEQTLQLPIVRHRLKGVHSRLGFAEAAEQKLRSLELDITHDTGAGWHCDVFQPHCGSRRVAIEHNLLLWPKWIRPLKHAVNKHLPRYRRFKALMARQYVDDGRMLLALSRQTAADFHKLHDVPSERIRLVYNGVDPERFSPAHREQYRSEVRRRLGIADDTLLLLLVAHNFPLKGVPALLRTTGRLAGRGRPVHLVVAGGNYPNRHQLAAGRLGIGSSVTFAGSVGDTVPFYAAADVYVHPTYHDPCSLVVLEALASGLPVITSRFNGAGELITEGTEGHVLSDPGDVEELVARLEPMFDSSRRLAMGRAARRLALKHSLDHNVDEVLAVYEEVIASRRRADREKMLAARFPFVCRTSGSPVPTRPPQQGRRPLTA